MPEPPDMSAPVTHAQLHTALEKFATKSDLEIWGGALLDRLDRLGGEIRAIGQRLTAVEGMEPRLMQEMARLERAAARRSKR